MSGWKVVSFMDGICHVCCKIILGVCKAGHKCMVVVLPTWSQSKVRLHLAKYQVSYHKPLTLRVMVTIVHKSVLFSPITVWYPPENVKPTSFQRWHKSTTYSDNIFILNKPTTTYIISCRTFYNSAYWCVSEIMITQLYFEPFHLEQPVY